jgi:hypothetical protein
VAIIIIITIFIYCKWVVTRWQWLFYTYFLTLLINLLREGLLKHVGVNPECNNKSYYFLDAFVGYFITILRKCSVKLSRSTRLSVFTVRYELEVLNLMLVVPYILVIKVNVSQLNVHFLLGKFFIIVCSTCFWPHWAHHQEHTVVYAAIYFRLD